jgi:ABC-type Zn uptake system ZnuABC Zn-binding protein ZnuA
MAAIALAGCGEDDGASPGSVEVVATTTQAAEIARVVGDDRAEVTGLLQPNSDAHGYEPRPSDAQAVATADLVVRSGGEVDEWLDEIARCIERLPAARRKLVTTHDALGYYASRYGLELVGALIPSLSSQAQPSAGDTQELVDQIRSEGVEAIFPESSLDPELEDAVAREAGADVGAALYADALGPDGSPGATYAGSLAANTAAIVEGLSGGRLRCRPGTRRGG